MLLICVKCQTPHSVGSPACPQCGETKRVEQGSPEHQALLAPPKKKGPGGAED